MAGYFEVGSFSNKNRDFQRKCEDLACGDTLLCVILPANESIPWLTT
jgi:hypothetical protein